MMLSPLPDPMLHSGPVTFLYRDYESRGVLPLDKVGAHKYAADARTEVMCCAYAVGSEPVQLWRLDEPEPPAFIEEARDPNGLSVRHNDPYETNIERHVMARRHGWHTIPLARHLCTMAAALALALPARLETLARVLHLEHQKDLAGRRLMLQMSKPRKPRKDEDPQGGPYWFNDSDRLARLFKYCKQDVLVERELHARLLPLLPFEQQLWLIDSQINNRGFHTDCDLARAACKIAKAAAPEIDAELSEVTGGAVVGVSQITKLLAWLCEHGCTIKDLQADTIEDELKSDALSAPARRALELRQAGSGAAARKVGALLQCADDDGRVRGVFQFHRASTGRWAGVRLSGPKFEAAGNGASGDRGRHRRGCHRRLQPRSLSLSAHLVCFGCAQSQPYHCRPGQEAGGRGFQRYRVSRTCLCRR